MTVKKSASFVFKYFQHFTGISIAFTTILQSFFGMCCYDAPAHITEEMKHASRELPNPLSCQSISFSLFGLFLHWQYQQNCRIIDAGPLIQIFYGSTTSVIGSYFLSSLILVIFPVGSNALMVEGLRSLFVFARDHDLPFSRVFAKVEKRRQIPIYAILLACFAQMALNSI